MSDVTHILTAIEQGDARAADKLLPLVYEELRKLAAHTMANEAANQTLQPTALVHEAWMRMVGRENPKFANRAQFFAAHAEATSIPFSLLSFRVFRVFRGLFLPWLRSSVPIRVIRVIRGESISSI